MNGNFYGVTYGATDGTADGIVFKLSDEAGKWVFATVYVFCRKTDCPDGALPSYDGLAYAGQRRRQALGRRITALRHNDRGWEISSGGWFSSSVPGIHCPHFQTQRHVIHDFSNASFANGLIADSAGHLYGSVQGGGNYHSGFLYKLVKNSDGTWAQKVMHNFCVGFPDNCASQPVGRMVLDSSRNLFPA